MTPFWLEAGLAKQIPYYRQYPDKNLAGQISCFVRKRPLEDEYHDYDTQKSV